MMQRRFDKGSCEFDVFETFYACAVHLAEVAYFAIARAYPKYQRDRTSGMRHRYERAFDLAKSYLTRYKINVRDTIVPWAKYKRHKTPYDFHLSDFSLVREEKTRLWEDRPTFEQRSAIFTQLYWLCEKLADFGPLMLPESDVESYEKVLRKTFETESKSLLEALSMFECDPKLTEKDFT